MKNNRFQVQALKLKKWDYLMIAGTSLSILVLMVVFQLYTTNAKASQIELVEDVMVKMSEKQKGKFEYYIEDRIRILQALVTYSDIYEMNEIAQKQFIYGRSQSMGFKYLFVVDMNGKGYYIEEGVRRNQSNDLFFLDIKNNNTFITEPFINGDGTIIMTLCVSIYNEQSEKVGILCGTVDLKEVQKFIDNDEMILSGRSYILNESGQYITSSKSSDVYNRISIFDTPNSELSLIEEVFEEREDKSGTIVLNGIEYQTHIAYLEDYHWAIVQNIPVLTITRRYANLNMMQGILVIFILILISCVVRIIYCWKMSNKKIYTDTLTKCSSRAACIALLDYLEENRKQQITIVYMDLNRFKWVNDTYGHEKGDELLKIFAKVLMQIFGKKGFVGRMGGDEFVSVLLDITEKELLKLWHQVEEELAKESACLAYSYQISSSYGYASRAKGDTKSLNTVLQLADKRMYENKAAGKSKQI